MKKIKGLFSVALAVILAFTSVIPSITINAKENLTYTEASNEKYASSYISNYYSKDIKNQIPYETCWAFAFCAASESSVRKEYGDNADFSEFQMIHFACSGVDVCDPMGLTKGDSYKRGNDKYSYLEAGGAQEMAFFNAASWKGVVDEEYAPYSICEKDKNAKLDPSLAYKKDAYYLSNCEAVPGKDIDAVKAMIVKHGSVASAYYAKDIFYNVENQYNTKEPVAEYCPMVVDGKYYITTNHAINIIGWDDNYSRENFGKYKPEKNGAWLCKNSWGKEWSKDGLFYISYEDSPLSYSNAYAYEYVKTDKYDYNYQYDGGYDTKFYGAKGANIYKATSDQQIKSVGYFTREANMQVIVKVYKYVTAGKPTSGVNVATKIITQPYYGYHTVDVDEIVKVNKDDLFSVVVEYKSNDASKANALVPLDVNHKDSISENNVVANPGESYVMTSDGSSWIEMDNSTDRGNCRIKVLTVDCSIKKVPVTSVTLNKTSVDLMKNNKIKLNANILPDNATNKQLRWKSSNIKVATVDANGEVTALGQGSAVITCTTMDGSEKSASCKVNVSVDITGYKIVLSNNVYEYTGKAITPAVTLINKNGNTVDKSFYTVSYLNNIEPGSAVVYVTGTNGCVGTCVARFDIRPTVLKIKQISNVKKGAKITWDKNTQADEYCLYRSQPGMSYELLVKTHDTSYIDTTAKNGVTYSYKLVAYKDGIASRDSNIMTNVWLSQSRIVSLTSSKPKTMKVKWAKNTKTTKYIISYSTDAKFKKRVKTVRVSRTSVSKVFKKLKSGKIYYVRVKVEKTVGGKTYQSVWSNIKKVKIK